MTARPESAAACRAVREQIETKGTHGRWLGIASGLWTDHDSLSRWRDEHGIAIPLVLDESDTLFHRFQITRLPTIIVIDAQGRIARRVEGEDIHMTDHT